MLEKRLNLLKTKNIENDSTELGKKIEKDSTKRGNKIGNRQTPLCFSGTIIESHFSYICNNVG